MIKHGNYWYCWNCGSNNIDLYDNEYKCANCGEILGSFENLEKFK